MRAPERQSSVSCHVCKCGAGAGLRSGAACGRDEGATGGERPARVRKARPLLRHRRRAGAAALTPRLGEFHTGNAGPWTPRLRTEGRMPARRTAPQRLLHTCHQTCPSLLRLYLPASVPPPQQELCKNRPAASPLPMSPAPLELPGTQQALDRYVPSE